MKVLDMWIGKNGMYAVPECISELGRRANEHAGIKANQFQPRKFLEFQKTPYFKIVEEWGNWRDGVFIAD